MTIDIQSGVPTEPDPATAELLAVLRTVLSEHELKVWLSTPTAWLGGAVPIDLITTDPDRVITAAKRIVSNCATL